jgi:hypothetical protein
MLKSTEALVAALKYDGVGMAEYKWNLKTVEIVCYGNICRSPFAAVLEQQLLSHGVPCALAQAAFTRQNPGTRQKPLSRGQRNSVLTCLLTEANASPRRP